MRTPLLIRRCGSERGSDPGYGDKVRWLAAVVVCGCGRFGFEGSSADAAPTCVPVGHDEDHDGIDDVCDLCPFLADPDQLDSDGDLLGDICDPNPMVAGERLVKFDSFWPTPDPAWRFEGAAPMLGADAISVDARGSSFYAVLDLVPSSDIFLFGGSVAAGTGGAAGEHQVAIMLRGTAPSTCFCELYSVSGVAKFGLTYTPDAAQFFVIDSTPAQRTIENGDLSMTLAYQPDLIRCETTWPASRATLSGPPPPGFGAPTAIALRVFGLVGRLDWFAQIHVGP